MASELKPGQVINYPYRWVSEAAEGRSIDGAKDRPVCVTLLVTRKPGQTSVYLLPISSKPPRDGQIAIKVPDTERRRAGLGKYPQAWLYVDDWNLDVVERSFYLEPQPSVGQLGDKFLDEVIKAFVQAVQAKLAQGVNRA